MTEHPSLTLSLMPLTDSAPLVVAEAAGFFAREGLHVQLNPERSWAAMRDKLAAGRCDGAALLAPMPLAAALGLDPICTPILAVAALNQGGSGFCVTPELHTRLCQHGASADSSPRQWAEALRRLVEAERGSRPPLTLAHVYPYSTHHYELRYWLGSVGLQPERDLNLVTVPPPMVVEQHPGDAGGPAACPDCGRPLARPTDQPSASRRVAARRTAAGYRCRSSERRTWEPALPSPPRRSSRPLAGTVAAGADAALAASAA